MTDEAVTLDTPSKGGDVSVTALHHVIHNGEHQHPGDTFSLGADDADELIRNKQVVAADAPEKDRLLREANLAREKALSATTGRPIVNHNRRRDDTPPEDAPTFDTTRYPEGDVDHPGTGEIGEAPPVEPEKAAASGKTSTK